MSHRPWSTSGPNQISGRGEEISYGSYRLQPYPCATALVPTAIERLYIDGCHLTTYQSFEFFQASYAADPVFIHFLHNAELINGNVVVRNDGVVVGETTYFSQQKGGSFGPATWAQMHEACIPVSRPSVHHGKRPYFLLNTLEGNYGHWHLQTLSNVNAYKLASGLFEEKLGLLSLLGLGYEGFRPDTLAALGLDASEIVQAPRDLTHPFERHDLLIVPSTLEVPSAARFSPYLLESLAPLRRRSIGGSPDRLYLTRKDVADRRGIRNSKDLESSLASLGFRSVTTGHMSYDEELQAFANADMVVCPHGGGLTNMIAHPPGLKILELFHSLQMNPWYKNLAALCGHRYSAYCIDPPADEASSKGWNASFDVSVSRVTEAVRAMISG